MLKSKLILFFIVGCCALYVSTFSVAHALVVEKLSDTVIRNDFVISPSKVEVTVSSGTPQTKFLYVTNRFNEPVSFNVSIQDFSGSSDRSNGAVLVGTANAKKYLKVSDDSFTLAPGERGKITVTVSASTDSAPTEVFGAVLVSGSTPSNQNNVTTKIISRLGALFFIRVAGVVKESGQLRDFSVKDEAFELVFENSGNVHLNPYGVIEVRNTFGTIVKAIQIDPWFVMPQFSRVREISTKGIFWWGRYKAIAMVNRGYQNQIDERIVYFWILPSVIFLLKLATALVLFFIIIFFIKIKRKRNA